jgi:hypothetical protein
VLTTLRQWVAMIQIDLHPVGETWYTWYMCTHDRSYVATFRTDPIELDWYVLLPRKRSPNTIHSRAKWFIGHAPVCLNKRPMKRKTIICWWIGYISLLGSYLQYVISTFNICSWEQTMVRSLTDTDTSATTLEILFCHITLPTLPSRQSSHFQWLPHPIPN